MGGLAFSGACLQGTQGGPFMPSFRGLGRPLQAPCLGGFRGLLRSSGPIKINPLLSLIWVQTGIQIEPYMIPRYGSKVTQNRLKPELLQGLLERLPHTFLPSPEARNDTYRVPSLYTFYLPREWDLDLTLRHSETV